MKLSLLPLIPLLAFLTSTTANCPSANPTKKDISELREWISKYQTGELNPQDQHPKPNPDAQPNQPPTEPEYPVTPVAYIKASPETTTISTPPSVPPSFPISDTAKNYRLRAQSSVNLGGWLVTESWLNPGLYDCAEDGVGELSLAKGCDAVSVMKGDVV